MPNVPFDKPVTVVPAIPAITTNSFRVVQIEESYGWDSGQSDNHSARPIINQKGVIATVVLNEDPYIERRMTIWENDDYLAVRGIWTDETLNQKIKEILQK